MGSSHNARDERFDPPNRSVVGTWIYGINGLEWDPLIMHAMNALIHRIAMLLEPGFMGLTDWYGTLV